MFNRTVYRNHLKVAIRDAGWTRTEREIEAIVDFAEQDAASSGGLMLPPLEAANRVEIGRQSRLADARNGV